MKCGFSIDFEAQTTILEINKMDRRPNRVITPLKRTSKPRISKIFVWRACIWDHLFDLLFKWMSTGFRDMPFEKYFEKTVPTVA